MKDLEIVDMSGIAAQMGHKPDTAEAASLACEFAKVIREWLTLDQMEEVIALNGTSRYDKACATHNFCDANVAMEEAMITCGHRMDEDPDTGGWGAIWNAGWDIAKRMNFDVELLNAYSETF